MDSDKEHKIIKSEKREKLKRNRSKMIVRNRSIFKILALKRDRIAKELNR